MKILIIFFVFSFYSYSQKIDSDLVALEEGEVGSLYSEAIVDNSEPISMFFLDLINLYRKKISVNSISRCPFNISCSSYTKNAIEKYGLLVGILFFIDRNQYRENSEIYSKYKMFLTTKYETKLDDSFFLYGSN